MSTPLSFSTLPAGVKQQPKPFELHIEEQKFQDFKTLLRLSPIGKDAYENQPGNEKFGVTREWMVNAKAYWENEFDWRKHEGHINSFPQYTSDITDDDGHIFQVHFAALFSTKKDATPLAFLHGWPGSFLEFLPILSLLKKKYTPEDLPYHIIVPSLPGYTLSSPPPLTKDWQIKDTARIIHKLLLSLGFGTTGYIVQGGDIGSYVSRTIAATYPEAKAAHLNFMMMSPPPSIEDPKSPSTITDVEKKGLDRADAFAQEGRAYGIMHGTRPATIGHVLSASPLALLAWIGEKFLKWVDPRSPLPLDTILADVTLYWLTECFPTCVYTYRQDFSQPPIKGFFHGQEDLYIDKPVGYSYFPYELAPIPRKWAETSGKVVAFKAHDEGGHFAALERPEDLLGDVEEFVGVAWKA